MNSPHGSPHGLIRRINSVFDESFSLDDLQDMMTSEEFTLLCHLHKHVENAHPNQSDWHEGWANWNPWRPHSDLPKGWDEERQERVLRSLCKKDFVRFSYDRMDLVNHAVSVRIYEIRLALSERIEARKSHQ